MERLTIYASDHTTANPHIRYEAVKWEESETYMADHALTFNAQSHAPIEWAVGDWCEFRGERFYLNYIPSCVQSARIGESGQAFVYDSVKMNTASDELLRCELLDVIPTSGEHSAAYGTNYTGSANFSLYCYPVTFEYQGETHYYCSAHALLDRIKANLDRLYPQAGWKFYIDDSKCVTDDYVVSCSNWTVAETLSQLHSTFVLKDGSGKHLEYIVRGRNIIVGDVTDLVEDNPELKGLVGYLTDVDDDGHIYYYGYGKGYNNLEDDGKGLFKITRNANADQQIITRLRVSGSSKNLPYRYYNELYSLPQTMFVTNLQLPQTFVPYTGSATVKPPYEYDNKTQANIVRDEIYGVDPVTGIPYIRHVKGDTNDAYIDKNDDAEHCPEGVRETSVRFDGSGELAEIYPTITECIYSELRANAVPDMDGNTSGANHFKNYDNDERVDEVLAPGEKCNYGSGIMSAKDVSTTTLDSGVAVIEQQQMSSVSTLSRVLFTTNKTYEGECIMSFTSQKTFLHLYMNVGRYEASMSSYAGITSYLRLNAKLIVKQAPADGTAETTVATYTFDPIEMRAVYGANDLRTIEIPLPDFGPNAFNTDTGDWDVEKLNLTAMSNAKAYVQIQITQLDQLPSNYGYPTLEWYVNVPTGTTSIQSKYQFGYSGADSYVSEPFVLILKDNGIDWNNLTLSSDEGVKITMNSGRCGGRSFTVDTSKSERYTYTRDGETVKCWKITCSERATDDSIHVYFPSEINPVMSGDQYVITGIELPDAYIRAAETRLLVAATEYLLDNQETKFTYQPQLDEIYLQRDVDKNELAGTPEKSIFNRLHAGMRFPFKALFDDTTGESLLIADITIEQVQIRMGEGDVPKVELKLNDDVTESSQQKMKITVDRIYGSLFGGGGGGSASIPSLLQLMRTEGTKMFLRKDIDDTAKGNIEFEQNIAVDGNANARALDVATTSHLTGKTTIGTPDSSPSPVVDPTSKLDVWGKSDHRGLAEFNGNYNVPYGNVGRVKGSLRFYSYDDNGAGSESADTLGATYNGMINGNGNAILRTLSVQGHGNDTTVTDLDGVTEITTIYGEKGESEEHRFVDGFDGNGLGIWKEGGAWHVTTDFLTVRQQMKVFELLIQKIRSTGGSIVVSPANGRIKDVVDDGTNWQIYFETEHDFASGDILRVQTYKGVSTEAHQFASRLWWGIVSSVASDGAVIVPKSSVTGGNTPAEGDEVVQWGNDTTTPGRDNLIYITAAENDKPAIDLLTGVNSVGSNGTLMVRIGNLDGINTGSTVLSNMGWGLYAPNCYLKGKFVLENNADVYQLFQVADGRMNSVISGVKALTAGDSIISNYDFMTEADGRNFPQDWHLFGVENTLISDTTNILSDGDRLLYAWGGTAYVAYYKDDVTAYMRIVNPEAEEPDAGFIQYSDVMAQNLWEEGDRNKPKTVEMRFRYRLTQDSQLNVVFPTSYNSISGNCSSDRTDEFYGYKSPFSDDGEWHECVYYGTYIGGVTNGRLLFLAIGQADIADVQCRVSDGVALLKTSITQTESNISLIASRVTETEEGLESANSEIQVNAGNISSLSTRVTSVEGDVADILQAGFVSSSDFAAQFALHFDDPDIITTIGTEYATNASVDFIESSLNDYALSRDMENYVDTEISNAMSGVITESNFASMFTGHFYVDQATGKVDYDVDAAITTYNFVEYVEQSGQQVIKGGILLKADQLDFNGGLIKISADKIDLNGYITANGNFKIDQSGNMECKDATITGVINNLINVIDVLNDINADKLVPLTIENGVCAGCNNVVQTGNLVDCLDALRLGDVVKLKRTNNRNIFLPFYLCEDVWIPSWNENFSCYFRAKTNYGGTGHLVTTDDLMQMVGRKINIIIPEDTSTTNGILYLPQLTQLGNTYVPPIVSGSGVNTPIIGVSVANKQAQFIGARLTASGALTLEFKIGELFVNGGGMDGNGVYTKCFYWALTGYDGQLPNWN